MFKTPYFEIIIIINGTNKIINSYEAPYMCVGRYRRCWGRWVGMSNIGWKQYKTEIEPAELGEAKLNRTPLPQPQAWRNINISRGQLLKKMSWLSFSSFIISSILGGSSRNMDFTFNTPFRILPPATPPFRSSTSHPGLLTSKDLITERTHFIRHRHRSHRYVLLWFNLMLNFKWPTNMLITSHKETVLNLPANYSSKCFLCRHILPLLKPATGGSPPARSGIFNTTRGAPPLQSISEAVFPPKCSKRSARRGPHLPWALLSHFKSQEWKKNGGAPLLISDQAGREPLVAGLYKYSPNVGLHRRLTMNARYRAGASDSLVQRLWTFPIFPLPRKQFLSLHQGCRTHVKL